MSGAKNREPVIAAGCLVTRNEGNDTEVLLVHRPKYDDWSLPKGKQDPGEHVLQTAVREVHEEAGLRVALRRPLPSREYLVEGQPKVVHYWRAVVTADEGFTATKEIDDVRWLPVATAIQRATHLLDGALIAQALIPPATPFVLLRHGKALKRAAWDGPDVDRPLDRAGKEQAEALVQLLATYGITRVHSSAAARCVSTVEPYARSIGTSVVPEAALTEEGFVDDPVAGLDRAAGLLADSGRNQVPTVLCGHRPVMPATLAHLLEDSDVVGPTGTIPAGSFVVLHMADGLAVAVEQHLLE